MDFGVPYPCVFSRDEAHEGVDKADAEMVFDKHQVEAHGAMKNNISLVLSTSTSLVRRPFLTGRPRVIHSQGKDESSHERCLQVALTELELKIADNNMGVHIRPALACTRKSWPSSRERLGRITDFLCVNAFDGAVTVRHGRVIKL